MRRVPLPTSYSYSTPMRRIPLPTSCPSHYVWPKLYTLHGRYSWSRWAACVIPSMPCSICTSMLALCCSQLHLHTIRIVNVIYTWEWWVGQLQQWRGPWQLHQYWHLGKLGWWGAITMDSCERKEVVGFGHLNYVLKKIIYLLEVFSLFWGFWRG